MISNSETSLEDRLLALFAHLGIERAHIAARGPSDWSGLVRNHPETVASLTLLCPNGLERDTVGEAASRLLILSGDRGPSHDTIPFDEFDDARVAIMPDYTTLGWTDIVAEKQDDIRGLMFTALADFSPNLPNMDPSVATEGEVAGITYRVRGSGPPLVLMPLFLAPSQWEPLIPALSERFTTITLGGPFLGPVVLLEARGKARGYREMLSALFTELSIKPDDRVLEVGCGSGAVMRCLAEKTDRRTMLDGVDINAYLLAEGRSLAGKIGFDGVITTQEGSALALPFPDNHFDVLYSVTVIEEVDADAMLAEMVRVTKLGGRIGVICRAVDLRWTMNAPVKPGIRAKLEAEGNGSVAERGCADASLYRRFREVGLSHIVTFPHLTPFTRTDSNVVDFVVPGRLDAVTLDEADQWHAARGKAEEDGSFFIAWPHHCAAGVKP
jgi:SAM-dependent methyltransferase